MFVLVCFIIKKKKIMNYPKIIKRMADALFLCVEATIFESFEF